MKRNYEYNSDLIERLNLNSILNKNNMNKESYNKAIFYALSSLDSHIKQNVGELDLLFGDYYSFEYYYYLKNDLDNLSLLTKTIKNNYYILLTKNKDIINFSLSLFVVLFKFYKKDFNIQDKIELMKNFLDIYQKDLESILDLKIEVSKLLFSIKGMDH